MGSESDPPPHDPTLAPDTTPAEGRTIRPEAAVDNVEAVGTREAEAASDPPDRDPDDPRDP